MPAGVSPQGSSPAEILADTREAFEQLESAISMADPSRCRPYVSDQLYAEVTAMMADLAARGHRRIHGSFEIVDAALAGDQTADAIQVHIHAISSIMEFDRKNAIVSGTPDLMSWQQDVTVAYHDAALADHHWVITSLGQLTVVGTVSGPAGQPMDEATVQAMEARQREREQETDEAVASIHRVHVSLMRYFQYRPM